MAIVSAREYMHASLQRLEAARILIEVGERADIGDRESCFAGSAYFSGVAVECMLRAFHTRSGKEFDAKHDIPKLAKDSGFRSAIPARRIEAYTASLSELWSRWRNAHRYYNADKLLKYLRKAGIDRSLRGDAEAKLRANAKSLYHAASELVALGERKWKSESSRID